jgi:uncharacterized YccA/Bax inhibitor family protein
MSMNLVMLEWKAKARKEAEMANSDMLGRRESPVLNSKTFGRLAGAGQGEAMTVQGAVEKTAILLAIVAASAAVTWLLRAGGRNPSFLFLGLTLASPGAFVLALITSANMQSAHLTAPLYAFLEGIVLGGISAVFEGLFPGIVLQAVLLTFATLFGLLVIYRASGFRVTHKFWTGVVSATLAIAVLYLLSFVLMLLGIDSPLFVHQSGLIGIVLSVVIVIIAALNLVLDFDLIESGAREGAPEYMEWYSAFGLMVTLIWLYLEVLELLIRIYLASSDNND